MSIQRFDGSNNIEIDSLKRFDGSNWVESNSGKRFDGVNWIEVYPMVYNGPIDPTLNTPIFSGNFVENSIAEVTYRITCWNCRRELFHLLRKYTSPNQYYLYVYDGDTKSLLRISDDSLNLYRGMYYTFNRLGLAENPSGGTTRSTTREGFKTAYDAGLGSYPRSIYDNLPYTPSGRRANLFNSAGYLRCPHCGH